MGEVLERKAFQAGQVIMHAMETGNKAYLIQKGSIIAWVQNEHEEKTIIGRYNEGEIVAENHLMLNEPSTYNYEAETDTTVIVLTQQDFKNKLRSADKIILQTINTLIQKIKIMETDKTRNILNASILNDHAQDIVNHLVRDMDRKRAVKYKEILEPNFTVMCNALDNLQREERHEKQRQALERKKQQLLEKDKQTGKAEASLIEA